MYIFQSPPLMTRKILHILRTKNWILTINFHEAMNFGPRVADLNDTNHSTSLESCKLVKREFTTLETRHKTYK